MKPRDQDTTSHAGGRSQGHLAGSGEAPAKLAGETANPSTQRAAAGVATRDNPLGGTMTPETIENPTPDCSPASNPPAAATARREDPPAAAAPKRHFAHITACFIRRNERNPRKHFEEAALQELAESIRVHGVLQPLVVRALSKAELEAQGASPWSYELIMGERRLRAVRSIGGLQEVPCIVYTGLSADQALEMALVENLQREDMNPVEEAEGFAALSELGYSQVQIAQRVGKSRGRVANAVRLLELPEAVKEHVRTGALSQKHAEGLLRFKEYAALLVAMAELAVKRGAPASALAAGMPYEQELDRAGLIKAIGYDELAAAGMDYDDDKVLKELKALPWVRLVKGANQWSDDQIYALDAAAWAEWIGAKQAAHEERNRKAAAKRQAELDAAARKTGKTGKNARTRDAEKTGRAKISEEMRAHVLDSIKAGRTTAETAKVFGLSVPTVHKIKKAAGLVRPKGVAAA